MEEKCREERLQECEECVMMPGWSPGGPNPPLAALGMGGMSTGEGS